MKFYMLLIFIGALELSAAGRFSRFKREVVSQSASLIRQKRAGLLELMFPSECISKCDEELNAKVNATGFEGTDNPFALLTMDPKVLEDACNAYETSKSCYSACAEKESSTSNGYKIMCEDWKSEVLKHMPCYKKADSATNTCEAQCGSPDTMSNNAEAAMNSTDVEDLASLGSLFDMFRPMCKFLICAIECGTKVIDEECPDDPEASKFFKEMTATAGTTLLQQLSEPGSSEGTDLMPKECRELIGSSDAKITKDGDNENGDDFMSSLFKPDSSSGSDMFAMAQKLIDQQSTIYEKTSRNLDVELEKMELEMKLLKKQLGE